jgi:hypothetical protein
LAALEDALRLFRSERAGVLSFDEQVRPVRFVTDPSTGHVVAPAPASMLECFEAVLFVPEESDDALQLLLTPEPIDNDNHPAVDRWRIHHGEPGDARWVRFHVESARRREMVFDGDAFMRASPVADAEAGLCKKLNADRDRLARLCKACAGLDVEKPVCVGVDQDGLHVRARFGIVRAPFEHEARTPEEARRAVDALLARCG